MYKYYNSEPDEGCCHNKKLVFRLLSRQKSFYLRCDNQEDRDSWLNDMSKYIKIYQDKCVLNGLIENSLTIINTAPMRVYLRQNITECQLCNRNFTLFSRKHHCRSCGKCVCEKCSREKVRVDKIDSKSLLKVINYYLLFTIYH